MSQIGKLQTWKIPADKVDNWRRLNPSVPKDEATDCAVNSLYLLGVIDNPDYANILSTYANTNQRGMYDPEILTLIFNKFNEANDYKIINHKVGDNKTDIEIRKELQNNTYTIALYARSDYSGHAVILTKQKNVMYVFDPQQEECISELTNYVDWVNEQKFTSVRYILKNKITRKRNETTVKLRKKTASEHTRKRRRIGKSNSSSSTTKKTIMVPKKKTSSKNSSSSTTKKTNMVKEVPKKRKRTQSNHGSSSSSKKSNVSSSF
jgi:hypothetical protein